jgi:hypothetical protein
MAAAGVHGFPVVLTSFVGRAGAVREVAGLLEEYRRVPVTGPGGVGKTRLVGAVARQVAARFADGAWLAELAPVRDQAQVAAAVAVALGATPGTLGVSVYLGCSVFRVLYVFLSLFSWWRRRRAGIDGTRVSRRVRRAVPRSAAPGAGAGAVPPS